MLKDRMGLMLAGASPWLWAQGCPHTELSRASTSLTGSGWGRYSRLRPQQEQSTNKEQRGGREDMSKDDGVKRQLTRHLGEFEFIC